MKTILLTALLSIVLATTAYAQAGPGKSAPKKKKKAKPDTTRVERTAPDTTSADTTRARQAKPAEKPAETPAEAPAAKPPRKATPTERPRNEPPPNRPGFSRFVPRAVFCTDVVRREPVGMLDSVVTAVDTVCFFTEISGLAGTTISHRWKHDGEVRAEVAITIGGPHWRVYTRKSMHPEWTGEWIVEVVDADTRVLARRAFIYRPDSTATRESP